MFFLWVQIVVMFFFGFRYDWEITWFFFGFGYVLFFFMALDMFFLMDVDIFLNDFIMGLEMVLAKIVKTS